VIKITRQIVRDVIDAIEVPKEFLKKVYENVMRNETITNYYRRLKEETNLENLTNKARSVEECNTVIEVDRYETEKVKDYIRTNLCRDKFCNNCKKVLQATRMAKYIPVLKKQRANLYHMTLTQPNCSSEELEQTIKKMSKKFRLLIQILRGEIKIKDLDFSAWGYEGAIRSLEITFKSNPNDPQCYHPHYHVAIAFNHKTTLDEKHVENIYSKSRKSPNNIKLFSSEEILIQKIWYLLMNEQKITKKSIDALEIGYSCAIDRFKKNDYAELFKYLTKTIDENSKELTYEHFKTLYFALHRVKQIQGYGIFYNVKDEVTEEEIEQANSLYDALIAYLKEKECPIQEFNRLEDLLKDTLYTLISRKRILKHLIRVLRE
jgi:hypothetical protein